MAETSAAKVWSPGAHQSFQLTRTGLHEFCVGGKWNSHEPPWVVVNGPVFVTGEKPVQAQRATKPENPALKIGLTIGRNEVMREANRITTELDQHAGRNSSVHRKART